MTYATAPAPGTEIGVTKALSAYFGRHPGQSLAEFAAEIKALSPDEKAYLAEGAARELGCTLTAKPGA